MASAGCNRGIRRVDLHHRLLVVVMLTLITGLSACSAPKRAPVSSRELSASKSSVVHSSFKTPITAKTYRIKKGDTLFSIAWVHGVDQNALAEWNHISPPYLIYPGQILRLTAPKKNAVRQSQQAAKAGASSSASRRNQPTTAPVKTIKRSVPDAPKSKNIQTATERVKLYWSWPTKGKVRNRFLPSDPSRKGVDIAGRSGQAIYAAESGKVVYAGSGLVGYGRLVIIKHNKNYLSAYGYNRKILVKEGDQVSKGFQIAEMGNSGQNGAVLHFEIRRNGAPVNPLKLLP